MNDPLPKMVRVNAGRKCPVCGKPDWCLLSPDGKAAICARVRSPKECGDAGWLHRLEEPLPAFVPVEKVNAKRGEWYTTACRYFEQLMPEDRAYLAMILGLPENGLNCISLLGWCVSENLVGCYTFPERDGIGNIIGISRRFQDGTKKHISGGQRGLTLPNGWDEDVPGPLYILEGPTDTAAMVCAGLKAIARPSNRGGVALLNEALKRINPERLVIVVGENDRKPDGLWPGLEGAVSVAGGIKEHRKEVGWILPTTDYKDVREFLTSEQFDGEKWTVRGVVFQRLSLTHPAKFCRDGYAALIDGWKRELMPDDERF